MATAVCRGLQSCLDTHLVQEPLTTLRLKLFPHKAAANHSFAHSLLDLTSSSPPHSHPLNTTPQQPLEDPWHYHHHHHNHHNHHHPISSSSSSNPNMGLGLGGWSFLQALSTTNCQEPSGPDQEPPVYVHPLARASSLRLSPRSLDLCTENLGSESSNIFTFDDDDNDDGDPKDESKSATREQTAPRPWSTRQITDVENASKKAKPRTNINNSNSNGFPPPLTTIAKDSIRVRPHREEGRLIIEAMRAPQANRSCFRADRSHGRLRLCFFKDTSLLSFDSAEQDDGGEKGVEGRTDGDAESETAQNDVVEEDKDEEEEVGEELSLVDEEEEEEVEQDGDWDDWEEEEAMEGAPEIAGGHSGMERLRHHHHHRQRPSWCKEGGGNEHEGEKRLLNCRPFLVATS